MIQAPRLWRTSKEQLKSSNRGGKKGKERRERWRAEVKDIGLKVKKEKIKESETREETDRSKGNPGRR